MTYHDVQAIGDMVQSTAHPHMSIRGLALHAQRIGKVFAHPGTWSKLIRDRGWRRPRFRLYPAKPKVGLRAQASNDAWHVDVSVLKLLNQTMPHSAFQGQAPDEMYFGRSDHLPDELAARRRAARQQRVAYNRSAVCSACPRAAPVRDDDVTAWCSSPAGCSCGTASPEG